MLGFLIRNTKEFKCILTLINLNIAVVMPHLVIWSPIERESKKKLKYLYYKKYNIFPVFPHLIAYKSLLEIFKIHQLNVRRQMQSLLFIYPILNNLKYKFDIDINSIYFSVRLTDTFII